MGAILTDNINSGGLARELIRLGARTDILVDGKNLLDIAIDNNNESQTSYIIDLLLTAGLTCEKRHSKDHNMNLALIRAPSCSFEVVKYLVSIEADVDYRIEPWKPALFETVHMGRYENASFLIDQGAEINIAWIFWIWLLNLGLQGWSK